MANDAVDTKKLAQQLLTQAKEQGIDLVGPAAAAGSKTAIAINHHLLAQGIERALARASTVSPG
ncbi:hypothetical protein KHQ06_21785 [Nocardia tengchongensis]|uniref:Uncharacterized protein n=1 Tax=Nocardia tengchongensis TaxID=2055889 RepID=A0ABX8CHU6_9NOCA|nr:hypothetical protein [Nocardia tengchongensis]QVI19094.1 hypothetical protein KHQ06_21785 [Nocardia tengchongensis]